MTVRELVEGLNILARNREGLVREIIRRPGWSFCGGLYIRRGEILVVERQDPGLTGLDLLYRISFPEVRGRFPILSSSARLGAKSWRPGDRVEVAYVTNYAGNGLYTAFAPSELCCEGLLMRAVQPAGLPASVPASAPGHVR